MAFKLVDEDGNGIITEEKFRRLMIERLQIVETTEELDYLIKIIDPYNN